MTKSSPVATTNQWWANKRVVVTGGTGFLGRWVDRQLRTCHPRVLSVLGSSDFDLTCQAQVGQMFDVLQPDVIIHLAARVGGIGANRHNPARFFYDNAIMGIELLEQAHRHNTTKVVLLGTVCAYPKHTAVPFSEDHLWNGYPEETNAPYGIAKKMLLVQAQAYRQQYGLDAIYLLPVNLYGPGDHFDPRSSHVIPALVKKFVDGKRSRVPAVTVWGTGSATREFLYVEDAARAIVLAAEHYSKPAPVNIGSAFEISIRDLAQLIARLVGFEGTIAWDSALPDGQARRKLNVSRAAQEFGFKAQVDFDVGLRATIEHYAALARVDRA